ncbi:MAG: single-stranded DNA-binding protein [Blastocatellia bacterium]
MSLCKVNLIGYVGKGAELKFTPQGQAVCEFYLGVNNRSKDSSIANNEDKDKATWFRISIWGKQAENISQYLSKGKQVYIEGHLKVKEYVAKDGSYRTNLEVNATEYQLLGGGNTSQAAKTNAEKTEVEDPFIAN